MKWTILKGGKTVTMFRDSGVRHNPPCQTERCKRRNAAKAQKKGGKPSE